MLQTISREAGAYDTIYHGKTILLKVSGAEIESPDFATLVSDIRALVSKGVRIVVTFGGGEQISKAYGKPREKIDGVGVTTDDVLRNGVIPAYHTLRAKFRDALPECTLATCHDIDCEPHPDARFGHVGIPTSVQLPNAALTVVGFVGKSGSADVNVNADDIARCIALQYQHEIEELIFLTNKGGVEDTKGRIVPVLTDAKIDAILRHEDREIVADGGMEKKLAEIRRSIDIIGKVVITKTSALRAEIEQWMGSGTLCIDSKQLSTSPMRFVEEPIFDTVYRTNVETGTFRERNANDVLALKTHHRMLRIKNSPLGGFSLVPRSQWLELSTLWAGTIGNGIGRILCDTAIDEAGKRPLYALSTNKDAIYMFREHPQFIDAGPLSYARQAMAPLPEHLTHYDVSERNPRVFLARKTS